MTLKAVFQFKVGLTSVAFATLRYVVHHLGRMALVAISTGDLGLVACTIFRNVFWLLIVAFHTIGTG